MKDCSGKKILLISMDIVGVLEDCEKEIFQDVVQSCIVHLIRNT